jgi:hypothetical protein
LAIKTGFMASFRRRAKLEKAKTKPRGPTAREMLEKKRAEKKAELYAAVEPSRDIPLGLRWYAFISKKPRTEHTLAVALQSSHSAFCIIPMERPAAPQKRAGKHNLRDKGAHDVPLLPRMVFAGFQDVPSFWEIEQIAECQGWLRSNGMPATLSERGVMAFRDETEAKRHYVEPKVAMQPGVQVRLKRDMVAMGTDETAQIQAMQGKYAVLSKLIMGRNVKVSIDDLEVVAA